MERRKSIKPNGVNGPISAAPARSDLLHHLDAISLALKNWNDTEALKLLRLHWVEIAYAIRRPDLPEGITVAVRHRGAVPRADHRISQFDDVIDGPANDGGHLPGPRLRTVP